MSRTMPEQRGRRGTQNHDLTESEWVIIKAVWDHEPCAAPTIQEELQTKTGWTYSTVKTFMDRMVEKGFLSTQRVRNLILYSSKLKPSQARKSEVKRTLKRAFDGALTPMIQFLLDSGNISQQELDELELLIKDKRRRTSKRKKRG